MYEFNRICDKKDDSNYNFIKMTHIKDEYCRSKSHIIHLKSFSNVTSFNMTLCDFCHELLKKYTNEIDGKIILLPEYFKPFNNLKVLIFNDLIIEKLDENTFQYLPNLEKLEISKSNIIYASIETLKNLTQLQNLYLEIKTFHEFKLNYLVKLKYLKLTNCGISDLKESTFKGLVNLCYINLKGLNLSFKESGYFKSLNSLRCLYFQKCNIKSLNKEILMEIKKLKEFRLDNREEKIMPQSVSLDIDWYKGLQNIEFLYLIGCNLTLITDILNLNKNLRTLDMSYNRNIILENSCFLATKNLNFLYLNSCGIKNINTETFASLDHLELLNLSDNPLCLEYECFIYLKSLKKLDLSWCDLKFLKKNTFAGLNNLEELNLSSNKIKSFERDCFDHMTKLTLLHRILEELENQTTV